MLTFDRYLIFLIVFGYIFHTKASVWIIQQFSYTGSVQTFTVPDGVTSLNVTISGAGGNTLTMHSTCTNGKGATVTGFVSVTSGATLYVYLGGQGIGTLTGGGFNGGGNPSQGGYNPVEGSGGCGASDIRTSTATPTVGADSRIIVAGGGGGCDSWYGNAVGGDGGGTLGGTGVKGASPYTAGSGGSLTAGGAGGGGGTSGALFQGGNGPCCDIGAGGGGGYYGGGGGDGGGGGGGSSLIPSGGVAYNGAHTGNGVATISYIPVPSMPPTVVPSSAPILPTSQPSSHPTIQPTSRPSNRMIFNFGYTGSVQQFMVPTFANQLVVQIAGASGGSLHTAAGNGGYLNTTLYVVPGSTLYVYIGGVGTGSGQYLTTGGFNGGGASGSSSRGSSGGGASDIRLTIGDLSSRLVVAGGGGGGSYLCGARGGNGGGKNASIGATDGCGSGYLGGAGGTQTSGYAKGNGGTGVLDGGGGGGGYYGGYGGIASGGGGGSSYSSGTQTFHKPGYNNGNGWLTLTLVYAPSSQPSSQPSSRPSIPTSQPSHQPSEQPSAQPTRQPTVQPSSHPSKQPTVQPTGQPSMQPISKPSNNPTTQPSWQPLSQPSTTPSCQPIIIPSAQPSVQPSSVPTCFPSETPSAQPSKQPNGMPSVQPSRQPSNRPSRQPTTQPTSCPTSQPSCAPTSLPSGRPSEQPSNQPLSAPTSEPSQIPSAQPMLKPTSSPSIQPNSHPSVHPSSQPRNRPSTIPSSYPTSEPSQIPTCRPSVDPSVQPGVQPSKFPSTQPSVVPHSQPTSDPSANPSDNPTNAPSVQPSDRPTHTPSNHPSGLPTVFHSQQITVTKSNLSQNATVSVVGFTSSTFKIVIPQYSMIVGKTPAYSDIIFNDDKTAGITFSVLGNHRDYFDHTVVSNIFPDTVLRSASVIKDFNGDGFDDLIIGDPFGSKCYLLYGNEFGLRNMTTAFIIMGESETDLTGWSVNGAGDVNNDTIDDIIIGAPNARGTGAVYVIYGNRTINNIFLNDLADSQGFVLYGTKRCDFFGISVSFAGDVNKDGIDDILIGAIGSAVYYAGCVYVLFGKKDMNLSESIGKLSMTSYAMFTGSSYQYAGISVSGTGDMNGDGYDDIIIGTSPTKAGLSQCAYIIYGAATLTSMSLASITALNLGFTVCSGGTIVSFAGDINHDGYNDALISSNVRSSNAAGLIVYWNSSIQMSTPTIIPTDAIHRRRPTVSPSLKPTHQPTLLSATSVIPVYSQNISPMSPPTIEPTEAPSTAPTNEPTELSSQIPTEIPSIPLLVQASLPTRKPSLTSVVRAPVTEPTRIPTIWTTKMPVGDYYVWQTSVYNDSMSSQAVTRYIVNATGNVIIDPSHGKCIYYIVYGTDLFLTIDRFNISSDVIDLSQFWNIVQYSDLVITAGSVIINLPTKQVIRILNQEPAAMSERNFVFARKNYRKDKLTGTAITAATYLLSICGFLVTISAIYRFYQWLFPLKFPRMPNKFVLTYEYDKLTGQFRDKEDEFMSISSFSTEDHHNLTDDHLSDRTLDSNYEWQMKTAKVIGNLSDFSLQTINSDGQLVRRETVEHYSSESSIRSVETHNDLLFYS